MDNRRKLLRILILLFIFISIGVIGYKCLLDISWLDAIYMTVITISTVGYKEVGVFNEQAQIFSIIFIIMTISVIAYLISNLAGAIFEGDIKKAWRIKRMEKNISELKDHFIICGCGKTGKYTVKELVKYTTSFLVIEKSPKRVEELMEEGVNAMLGDATEDEVLKKAGIDRAKGLVTLLRNDSDGVFVVLSARQLNPKLHIISRVFDEGAYKKYILAGANQTISPDEIGGHRIASTIVRPTVISFLDTLTHAGDMTFDLEDIIIRENSSLCDLELKNSKIPEKTGLIVIAIKKKQDRDILYNPKSNTILQEGDTMIVLGMEENIKKLRLLANDDGIREFF